MTTQAPQTQPASTQRRLVKGSIALLATVTVAVTATFCLGGFSSPADDPSTDDAYVSADSTLVSPRIAGHVSEVLVIDNQPVHAGQLLATIDDRDFRLALTSAQAQAGKAQARYDQAIANLTHQQTLITGARAKLSAANAQVVFAEQELNRYLKLAKRGAGSLQQAQKARTQLATAKANRDFEQSSLEATIREVDVLKALKASAESELAMARASVEQASLNLSYTRIKSPIDGYVTQRSVRLGAFVSPGASLLAVV
ncbi:MAG: HlyD family secretion protein, partial [Marinobacter sp.]|nr:HlyD family secretion protein [Marinobacter sp.]